MRFTVLVFIVFLFGGCATNYNISPIYDASKKILKIDGYIIKNVAETRNRKNTGMAVNQSLKKYTSSFYPCSSIVAINYTANGYTYYVDNAANLVAEQNKNCYIEKINNINFLNCGNEYIITSSEAKDLGYDNLKNLIVNESCFYALKNYFVNKSKSRPIIARTNSYFRINQNIKIRDIQKIKNLYYTTYPIGNFKYAIEIMYEVSIPRNNIRKGVLDIHYEVNNTQISKEIVKTLSTVSFANNLGSYMCSYKTDIKNNTVYDISCTGKGFVKNKISTFQKLTLKAAKQFLHDIKNGIKTETILPNIPMVESKVVGMGYYRNRKVLVVKNNLKRFLLNQVKVENRDILEKTLDIQTDFFTFLDPKTLQLLKNNLNIDIHLSDKEKFMSLKATVNIEPTN